MIQGILGRGRQDLMTSSQHPLFQLSTIPELLGTLQRSRAWALIWAPGSRVWPARTLLVRGRVSTGLARSPLLTAPERPWAEGSSRGKKAVGNEQN